MSILFLVLQLGQETIDCSLENMKSKYLNILRHAPHLPLDGFIKIFTAQLGQVIIGCFKLC